MKWLIGVVAVVVASCVVVLLRGIGPMVDGLGFGLVAGALFGLSFAQWRFGVVQTVAHKKCVAAGALIGGAIGNGAALLSLTTNFYFVVFCLLVGVFTVIFATLIRHIMGPE